MWETRGLQLQDAIGKHMFKRTRGKSSVGNAKSCKIQLENACLNEPAVSHQGAKQRLAKYVFLLSPLLSNLAFVQRG